VIDEPTRGRLQECVRREGRSLLQYVREVPVWVAAADRATLAKLRALALAEQQVTDELGRYLQKKQVGLPSLGPYPSSFMTVNDAALHHLLPRLLREQRAALAALEADADRVDDVEARAYLERLLGLKQRHLAELEKLSAQPHTKTGVPTA
jgi:hypothetical protein